MRIPGGAPQRRDARGRQRPQIAPLIAIEVVSPDRRVIQVNLAEPVPAVIATERRKAQELIGVEVEDILLRAADARRGTVRLPQLPTVFEEVVGPCFGVLLPAATLIVAAPPDDFLPQGVVTERGFIAHP